jgi:HTH-type transcriptional regulator/antitoxin HigA
MERRANDDAADALIPRAEMESFIRRVGPLYSKDKIIKFAHRIKMHPGVIVGQLQRRSEIGYSANREMLAKIRGFVVSACVTDGWGHTIDQRST